MSIGEYLKELRHQRNLSAREAAKRIGISYTRLQELENGYSRTTGKPTSPTTDVLIKIAKGYEQPLPLLLQMAGLTPVSQDERQEAELLQIFRGLSEKGRNLAVALVRTVEAQDKQ
ncbi:helix-turn-helix transcriptional regulator [bacterium]|nr:helix-turn-helix transcriptional regulator [bacterium]